MPRGNNRSNGFSPDPPLTVKSYFAEVARLIPRLPFPEMDGIATRLLKAYDQGRTVFVFGNGGSAASASHMMCDMNKGTIDPGERRRFKVLALTDNVPLLTAWGNDYGYDQIFAGQLGNFITPDDIAFAISGSGNSSNVVVALRTARQAGAATVGLAGHDGGAMRSLCDICAVVPSDNVQIVEDLHHAMLHCLFSVVRDSILSGHRPAQVDWAKKMSA